jgi:hypothetical protein
MVSHRELRFSDGLAKSIGREEGLAWRMHWKNGLNDGFPPE